MTSDIFLQLQSELQSRSNGYVHRCEVLLGKAVALNDPDTIGKLLPLLDDDAEYDELMFSIIHTIEMFDDAVYLKEVTKHLDLFITHSPRWALIVVMRMLNSPPTMAALTDHIKNLSTEERRTVQKALEAVQRKNAAFELRCNTLLAAL